MKGNEMTLDSCFPRPSTARDVLKIVSWCALPDALILPRYEIADIHDTVEPIWAKPVATKKGAWKNVVLVITIPSAGNVS